jgi:hypothetical protein
MRFYPKIKVFGFDTLHVRKCTLFITIEILVFDFLIAEYKIVILY